MMNEEVKRKLWHFLSWLRRTEGKLFICKSTWCESNWMWGEIL